MNTILKGLRILLGILLIVWFVLLIVNLVTNEDFQTKVVSSYNRAKDWVVGLFNKE